MKLSQAFGPVAEWPEQDLLGWSDEFDADLALESYLAGVFPTPVGEANLPAGAMCWWSPVRRAILPLGRLRVTRSLRQSRRRYRVSVDEAFDQVIIRCGDPRRPYGWINEAVREAYTELWDRGFVHSVEVWTAGGELAGGLYGVSIGGLFAGESMFHDSVIGRDASKVALVHLVHLMDDGRPDRLLDVQWLTPHLASLGAVEVDRAEYLDLLSAALEAPALEWGNTDA